MVQRLRWLLLFGLFTLTAMCFCRENEGSSGFDLSQLDRSADPCVDFYQFACGGWRAKNPLPPYKPRYNRYEEMNLQNQMKLREVLESAAKDPKNVIERQVGDYYSACMDEAAAEQKAASPLQPLLNRISEVADRRSLFILLAYLEEQGVPTLFAFTSAPDRHNSRMAIADLDQLGLSLPDRDYYVANDSKAEETRQTFLRHMHRMFILAAEPDTIAQADAKAVLEIETQLAKASLDRTSRRNPANLDHKMSLSEIEASAPNVGFDAYLGAAGARSIDYLNVETPGFFQGLSFAIAEFPLEQWKTYLRWKVIRQFAPMLSSAFVSEDYQFNSVYLRGTASIEPRWERCVTAVDSELGEASGKLFVDRYFGRSGKKEIQKIVENEMHELANDIRNADWMTAETKRKALLKLRRIKTNKLGFPSKYRDYSSILVKRDDYIGNYERASSFETHRQIGKIGRPVDQGEWDMTPPTVNGYYDPARNEIVFPAGFLQPPMFDPKADEAYSYGAIGRAIGHELTHGFDDEGRKFDADGNVVDWWTAQDANAFDERAACIEKQYSQYSPVDDGAGKPLYLNGKLTLGENIADNGGLRMAYSAYFDSHRGKRGRVVDGFTPAQRVFLGYAISRCENVTSEMSRVLLKTDPHAPAKFRLIGPITNMEEFQKAFACRTGQPMAPEQRCRVW